MDDPYPTRLADAVWAALDYEIPLALLVTALTAFVDHPKPHRTLVVEGGDVALHVVATPEGWTWHRRRRARHVRTRWRIVVNATELDDLEWAYRHYVLGGRFVPRDGYLYDTVRQRRLAQPSFSGFRDGRHVTISVLRLTWCTYHAAPPDNQDVNCRAARGSTRWGHIDELYIAPPHVVQIARYDPDFLGVYAEAAPLSDDWTTDTEAALREVAP